MISFASKEYHDTGRLWCSILKTSRFHKTPSAFSIFSYFLHLLFAYWLGVVGRPLDAPTSEEPTHKLA